MNYSQPFPPHPSESIPIMEYPQPQKMAQNLRVPWLSQRSTWRIIPVTVVVVVSFQDLGLRDPFHMSNGLNLLHPQKDVAEMVIVFCVSLIVPEDLMCVIKFGKHVYQKSSFFCVTPYHSWGFHDSIKYQCPGVTVPKCRRFCIYGHSWLINAGWLSTY